MLSPLLTGLRTPDNLAGMMQGSEPYALGPGKGRFIDLGDFGMTVKATETDTAGVVSVLEAEEPPGFGPPIHVHHDCAEAFYVLDGEYIIFLDDREVVCPAGSFIFIPQGARHGFRVGNVPSRKLNFYFPASMVGYFDDLAAALRRDDVRDDDLAEIAVNHAMEIVGPPSERYV
ncbi:MAG: cupin domain-containing protein [Actinobacteria bacterium]|nr:cupin domain-containing protein [Actinomycetota bacterium]